MSAGDFQFRHSMHPFPSLRISPAMNWTNSVATSGGTGDAGRGARQSGVVGDCLHALAQANSPRRSKTDAAVTVPDWSVRSR